MDYIDMLVNSSDKKLTGYFYKRRPKTREDGRITFKYEQLDPNSRVFDKLLDNVRADRAIYAIKTNENISFNVGGYIVTQNGLIWEISEVVTNEQEKGSNEVLRWFTTAKNAECNLRMVQIENLFDYTETLVSECKISLKCNVPIYPTYIVVNGQTVDIDSYDYGYEDDGKTLVFYTPKGSNITVVYAEQGTYSPIRSVHIKSLYTTKNEYSRDVEV